MKKSKRSDYFFKTFTILFLISTIVLSILYVQKNNSSKTMTKFSIIMVEAFANAVDYTLCNADADMGNIKRERCSDYTDKFVSDTQELRNEFGMETEYFYIGK